MSQNPNFSFLDLISEQLLNHNSSKWVDIKLEFCSVSDILLDYVLNLDLVEKLSFISVTEMFTLYISYI